MTKNITLSVDEAVLDKVRVKAAQAKTTVNAIVRESLMRFAEVDSESTATAEKTHDRMKRLLAEGDAKYADRPWFDREETYDRDYQRAQGYFENRTALLKLVDETTADFGSQTWNRKALYDR